MELNTRQNLKATRQQQNQTYEVSSESDEENDNHLQLKQSSRLNRASKKCYIQKSLKQFKDFNGGFYRSSSSTPDSIALPSSVSSSGISSMHINNNSLIDPTWAKIFFKCTKKINQSQKLVKILIGFLQRILNDSRPTKNDILGKKLYFLI